MDERNITFSDIEIEKHKFHYHKNPMLLDDSKVSVKKNEKKIISFCWDCFKSD